MLDNLSHEQLKWILETIPIDISFVDENDKVRFWNKHESRMFKRPRNVLGRSVQDCHPPQSVGNVNRILDDFKSGKRDFAEFWIDLKEKKFYIRYFAVRDRNGKYIGTLETGQDITDVKKIEGEKRLLDEPPL